MSLRLVLNLCSVLKAALTVSGLASMAVLQLHLACKFEAFQYSTPGKGSPRQSLPINEGKLVQLTLLINLLSLFQLVLADVSVEESTLSTL